MADTWEDWLRNPNSGSMEDPIRMPPVEGLPATGPGYDGSGIGNTGRPRGDLTPYNAGIDWADVEKQLREAGGGLYDPSDLEGIRRNTGYNVGGVSLDQALQSQRDIYAQRRGPQAPAQTQQRYKVPGLQFDDPYSNLLEQIGQRQLGEVRNSPALDQLMSFLTKQFTDLSTNPGYSPAEQAMLNTQAFEPIEAQRQASKQRAIERAAARGLSPSSGLHELDLRDIERSADQARTVAARDLAIAGLDRRDRDLSRALDLGQLAAIGIPRQQRGEEMAIGNLLYQLPRNAMNDALSVISGTPSSSDAFSQAIQLLRQQYDQQGRADANNAALYGQIGAILAGLFR